MGLHKTKIITYTYAKPKVEECPGCGLWFEPDKGCAVCRVNVKPEAKR